MIETHELNQEILIHCITMINHKIDKAYMKLQKYTAYSNYNKEWLNDGLNISPYYGIRDADISEVKKKLEELLIYRKPFLDLVMKSYKINLDSVKSLVSQADFNKLPTYKMIDEIRKIIVALDFRLT